MFEEHLYKLLQAHSRVIIPELGAFLRKDKTDTSEGTLIFSPFLRFNDGLIEEFLTEKEKISKSQASKMVQDFVHKVKDATEKQQTFAVKKMGTFYSDARGTIQFTFVDGAAAIPIKTEPPPKPKDKDKGKDKETPPPPAPVEIVENVEAVAVSNDAAEAEVQEAKPAPKAPRKGRQPKKPPTPPPPSAEADAPEEQAGGGSADAVLSRIDAAAAQLAEWQEKVTKKPKPPRDTAPPPPREEPPPPPAQEEEVEEETAPVRTDAAPAEMSAGGASAVDEISERARKIQRQKMMDLVNNRPVPEPPPNSSYPIPKDDILLGGDPLPPPERRRRRRSGRWMAALLITAGIAAAAFFLWDNEGVREILHAGKSKVSSWFGSAQQDAETLETTIAADIGSPAELMETPIPAPAQPPPSVKKQQKGIFYLAVAKFAEAEYAIEFCEILRRREYGKAEVVIAADHSYVVCIERGKSKEDLAAALQTKPYKYGKVWVLE